MRVLGLAALLLFCGAIGKSAQFPLHTWLPDAMEGPTPVSALIHAATMVAAGVFMVARLFPIFWVPAHQATLFGLPALAVVCLIGLITSLMAAVIGVVQSDIKRMLAYSTISQLGFMMAALGLGAVGVAVGIFHLLVHAFFKALLFLGAGCVITAMHHEQDIFKMGGLRRTLPFTFWPYLAGAACLAGLPLTGGFFSKDGILAALWLQGSPLYLSLYALALLTALLTAFYSFRMVYLVFGGPSAHGDAHGHDSGGLRLMQFVLIPLAFLGLFGGVLNLPEYLGGGFLDGFFARSASGTAAEGSHLVEISLQGVAGGVALLGLFAAHLRYGGKSRAVRVRESEAPPSALDSFLLNGWYFDRLYHALLIAPYRFLAELLWQRVDEGIIDDSLDRLAGGLGSTGTRLGSWSTGRVSIYILSFAAGGALMLGYLAWLSL
jgi:NADH-quinone oxidoreductase subunit L